MDKQLGHTEDNFESIKHTKDGVEFWSARELMPLLEYSNWENFLKVIKKAKVACAESGQNSNDQFPDVRKMIERGKGARFEIDDINLTRYACYLIAQNGDPRKTAIARAQTYFAVQTRKQELTQIQLEETKRVEARERLSQTEKKFSGVLAERGVDSKGIAEIRSSGDQILFGGHSTREMKSRYGVAPAKPLADCLPTVTLRAKDLAAEMTSVNAIQNDLDGKPVIKREHDQNNRSVRTALVNRGIKPETLPPDEDINKVKRRLKGNTKAISNDGKVDV